ncbi:hypothetical protein [Mycobacterium sp. 1245805.9]|uniref:hypothetical protein n=1 Tax=Mycobacterium sp. 1245805.9 TaxID=1856862 RepID=UPI000801B106|nr:hypothetical protein [Mycobacterium sp. 1245805.9]OBI85485.1 hypothetical protein A9X00_27570 [Mycobacterium sp. 1245805.9]
MIPYSDGIPARRFPIVNSALIAGSGVAFFAHVGGFVFGFGVARVLVGTDRLAVRQPEGSGR